jgi:hypothetical protein
MILFGSIFRYLERWPVIRSRYRRGRDESGYCPGISPACEHPVKSSQDPDGVQQINCGTEAAMTLSLRVRLIRDYR